MHSFARLVGHGLAVVPYAPARVVRGPENALDVSSYATGDERFARLLPDGKGGCRSLLDQGTARLSDVLEVGPGPLDDGWRIETSVFRCDWPAGETLVERDPTVLFEFEGPYGALLTVRGFDEAPPLRAAPGQRIVREDGDSLDLTYRQGFEGWAQRHRIVRFPNGGVVVSAQRRRHLATEAFARMDGWIASIVPHFSQ